MHGGADIGPAAEQVAMEAPLGGLGEAAPTASAMPPSIGIAAMSAAVIRSYGVALGVISIVSAAANADIAGHPLVETRRIHRAARIDNGLP
ncbi:MAG: hypothetical protein WDN04_15040 [Rhodospirillales bacterium]